MKESSMARRHLLVWEVTLNIGNFAKILETKGILTDNTYLECETNIFNVHGNYSTGNGILTWSEQENKKMIVFFFAYWINIL